MDKIGLKIQNPRENVFQKMYQKFVTDESSQKYDVTKFNYRCIKFVTSYFCDESSMAKSDTFSTTHFHEDFESLVQFDPSSTSIEKINFEKGENLVMGQLCGPIVADRHNVGSS